MIDTVRYEREYNCLHLHHKYGMLTIDEASGLRCSFQGTKITAVEVSLPRLLFGTNGKLIDSQKQIDDALKKADDLIAHIATPARPIRNFTRVDLVWHFRSIPPLRFFLAHQHCNFPEIKRKVTEFKINVSRNRFRTTGIEWQGDKLRVKMYDKTQFKDENGNTFKFPSYIVRVEITLRGQKLRDKLSHGAGVTNLNLESCYRCYRAMLLKFHPEAVADLSSKEEILFLALRKGIPVFDLLSGTMSDKTLSRLRKKMSKRLLESYQIDWNKLLPAGRLPQKYDAGKIAGPKVKFRFKKEKRIRFLKAPHSRRTSPRNDF